jgi:hypothetical protein
MGDAFAIGGRVRRGRGCLAEACRAFALGLPDGGGHPCRTQHRDIYPIGDHRQLRAGGEDAPKVAFAQNNNVVETVERCESYIPRGPARFRRLLTFDR